MTALVLTGTAALADAPQSIWSPVQVSQLRQWNADAPSDALPRLDTAILDRAQQANDQAAIATAATDLALRLARMHLLGAAGAEERGKWSIVDTDASIDLASRLNSSLASGDLEPFFENLRPKYPDYAVLRTAFASEHDKAHRLALARNMERWRWMPRELGSDFVLVNAAAFEAEYWHGSKLVGTRRVIVGKPRSPTPVLSAQITGMTLNPWWYVPANIVRESVGALVRRNPGLARRRGYVWSDGQIRQRPGPGNALGVAKLEMPNPFTVYMHDTPDHKLFDRDVRAFSHGCIRTEDVVGLGTALLDGAKSRSEIDAIIASGVNRTIALPHPVPVYVAYFTASAGANGTVRYHADIYGRDAVIKAAWVGPR